MKGWSILFLSAVLISPAIAQTRPSLPDTVGEKVPSEDAVLPDLHSLGLINGFTDIYRCGGPVHELIKQKTESSELEADAEARMKRLYDLGIRTVISFQAPGADNEDRGKQLAAEVALEKTAATAVGLDYVARPMGNTGPNSLQTMTDAQTLTWLEGTSDLIFRYARTGGVVIHCSAGHDRTGIVSAYLRLKYEHWPVDEAIAEMRRYGHNWIKFSANGGVSSWHEDHLRAIAKMLADETKSPAHP
jgi:hypothetical protein